jgi:hypothetical protein
MLALAVAASFIVLWLLQAHAQAGWRARASAHDAPSGPSLASPLARWPRPSSQCASAAKRCACNVLTRIDCGC